MRRASHRSREVSRWAAKVQAFAAELGARSGLPVELWDERLSSVAAHEILDEAGHDRRDRKQVIDQVACDFEGLDGSEAGGGFAGSEYAVVSFTA